LDYRPRIVRKNIKEKVFLLSNISSKEYIYRQFKEKGIAQLIKIDEPLNKHTSYHIGGPADFYCIPEKIDDLKSLISIATREKIPFHIIGNGTNLLIYDKGVRGLVIKLGKDFKKVSFFGRMLKTGAGISMINLSKIAFSKNLSGLEFACNIPGSLGGAIISNASFNGYSISEIIKSVTVLTESNKIKKISQSDLHFGYRKCKLKTTAAIILGAEIVLNPASGKAIKSKMEKNIRIRKNNQPLKHFSAGSIFKNPENYFAGALIEQVGAKGLSCGNAEVSSVHANFIINKGNALASDILFLIEEIELKVFKRFGIKMEREIEIIGEK